MVESGDKFLDALGFQLDDFAHDIISHVSRVVWVDVFSSIGALACGREICVPRFASVGAVCKGHTVQRPCVEFSQGAEEIGVYVNCCIALGEQFLVLMVVLQNCADLPFRLMSFVVRPCHTDW